MAEKFKIIGRHPHKGQTGKFANEHKFPPQAFPSGAGMYAIELDKAHYGTKYCYVTLDQIQEIPDV